jgi:hypothetical protein
MGRDPKIVASLSRGGGFSFYFPCLWYQWRDKAVSTLKDFLQQLDSDDDAGLYKSLGSIPNLLIVQP